MTNKVVKQKPFLSHSVCPKDDRQFAIQTGELFNEIQKRMSTDDNTSAWVETCNLINRI